MGASLHAKSYPKPLVTGVSIAVVAILIGAVPLVYDLYVRQTPQAAAESWLQDPEGDVEIIGEHYPSIVDLTYVRLDVDEGVLKRRITVKDSIPEHLGGGQYAQ